MMLEITAEEALEQIAIVVDKYLCDHESASDAMVEIDVILSMAGL